MWNVPPGRTGTHTRGGEAGVCVRVWVRVYVCWGERGGGVPKVADVPMTWSNVRKLLDTKKFDSQLDITAIPAAMTERASHAHPMAPPWQCHTVAHIT
jgi:hypothetical protein